MHLRQHTIRTCLNRGLLTFKEEKKRDFMTLKGAEVSHPWLDCSLGQRQARVQAAKATLMDACAERNIPRCAIM
jgi:hypothetical protein